MKKLSLPEIPLAPGVYRYFDEAGQLIYVGKAKNLRRRLSQYQNAKRRKAHAKMRKIFKEAKLVTFEVCENECLALIRENELIQAHRPKWNVAGAFFFLYPMIGVRISDDHLFICYTTRPELFPEFNFHGAFRSRFRTREGFFALVELLKCAGHAASRAQILKSGLKQMPLKHTYVYGFRQIPEAWPAQLDLFLKGESFLAIEELSLLLLEKPGALAKCKEIQTQLHEVRTWWRHEMMPLHHARKRCAWLAYPVPQKERDLLFIQFRNQVPGPSSTQELVQSVFAPSCQREQP